MRTAAVLLAPNSASPQRLWTSLPRKIAFVPVHGRYPTGASLGRRSPIGAPGILNGQQRLTDRVAAMAGPVGSHDFGGVDARWPRALPGGERGSAGADRLADGGPTTR